MEADQSGQGSVSESTNDNDNTINFDNGGEFVEDEHGNVYEVFGEDELEFVDQSTEQVEEVEQSKQGN